MFKIVYWRYGKRIEEEHSTLQEAHRRFNNISDYELGFPECILDENNKIIRTNRLIDGVKLNG